MDRIFKILSTKEKIDLIPYIKEYINKHSDVEVLIGCDSQNRKRNTVYAVCIVLYRPGKGGHVLFNKTETPRSRIPRGEFDRNRLLNETWYSVEVANEIKDKLNIKANWIDIDINNDKKWKSNTVLAEALGLVTAYGYSARYKNSKYTPVVTYVCDAICK